MFARIYDVLMRDVDYTQIADFLALYIKKEDVIIDLGCGSGYVMIELLKRDYHVIGIDNDPSMLALSYDKLLSSNLQASLYEHDIKDNLPVKVDVIYAVFDVINYFKGVKKVFENVYKALNKNGRFIFDVYKDTILEMYDRYEESSSKPIKYTWQTTVNKKQITHQVLTDTTNYQLKQYAYPLEYYLNILKDLGFKYEVTTGVDIRKHYIIATKQ